MIGLTPTKDLLKDCRWLLLGPGLWGPVGTVAIAASLLPRTVLPFPWWLRLAIGAVGVVLVGVTLPKAWKWVKNGSDSNEGGRR